MTDKKFAASAIFFATIAIVGFLFWFIPRYSSHAIRATRDCDDIFTAKAPSYFAEGKNRFVFNKNMNTCFLLNTSIVTSDASDRIVVVDMITHNILLSWYLEKGDIKESVL